jgi:hypothetical protein
MSVSMSIGVGCWLWACKYVHVPTVEKKKNAHAKGASSLRLNYTFFPFFFMTNADSILLIDRRMLK